ncbi:MAG: hypothetical protein O2960_19130 [Verrucomicrobia bacterium]|nr:hypothetical protein [Verrucomicrobiota bacterium]
MKRREGTKPQSITANLPPNDDHRPLPETSAGRRFEWIDLLGVFGSSGLGWFGILHLRLNLPEFVAHGIFFFEAFRRLRLVVWERGQGQCPVLNLDDGGADIRCSA